MTACKFASVLSFEKLKGDTINLYFDFLRQRSLSKQESVSLASSYFYASLDKPENMSSYKNYVGKKPLQNYEHLIIPVHLPTEEHWLLAIISIINLCIYIYDSSSFPENTYQSIFQTLKQKFINRERQPATLLLLKMATACSMQLVTNSHASV